MASIFARTRERERLAREQLAFRQDVSALQEFTQSRRQLQAAESQLAGLRGLPAEQRAGLQGPQFPAFTPFPQAQSGAGAGLFGNFLLGQQDIAGRAAARVPTTGQTRVIRPIGGGQERIIGAADPIPEGFEQAPRAPSTIINLAPSEREAVATNLATDDALNDLRNLVDANFVGPIKGAVGGIKDIFGLNTPQESEFRAATSAFRNQVIKEITGAQMSEAEAKRILKQVPQEKDPPSVWLAKWNQSKRNLERIRRRREQVQKRARATQPTAQETGIGLTPTEQSRLAELELLEAQ